MIFKTYYQQFIAFTFTASIFLVNNWAIVVPVQETTDFVAFQALIVSQAVNVESEPGGKNLENDRGSSFIQTNRDEQFIFGAALILEDAQRMIAPSSDTSSITPLENIKQITAGDSHNCVLTKSGGVKCWGANYNNQLGDGTTVDQTTPVAVNGLGSDVTAINAGEWHTCALTTTGGVKCWGFNYFGQLGDGTTISKSIPVEVSGLDNDVATISAGWDHTCALTTTGGVKCWGDNSRGQLGDDTTEFKSTPVEVSSLGSGVKEISAGGSQTCALTTVGGIKCWGDNSYGQLGDGTTDDRSTPVDVSGLNSGVMAISVGRYYACALTTAGGVKCWGDNIRGQLGDGTAEFKRTPVDVSGLNSGVTAINAHWLHTCALAITGGVKCWGDNYFGQLGDGTTISKSTPVEVSGLGSNAKEISAGGHHTCALTTVGRVKCWGENSRGQVGIGTTENKNIPVEVSGLDSSVAVISTGWMHTCALTTTGGVKCWGDNYFGQLGIGTTEAHSTPIDISSLISNVRSITAGDSHTCALTKSGGVKCWGDNSYGQLGDGSTISKSVSVEVSGLDSGVAAISAGGSQTCALTTVGGVKCWGANHSGQLGDGTTENKHIPVDVSGLNSGVTAISVGREHTCALAITGGVKCWGFNYFGQLGDDTTTPKSIPVEVSGLDNGVAAISTGGDHTCSLTTTGGVKCWGFNIHGQLGDGTTEFKSTPVEVSSLENDVMSITAGSVYTCALTTAGGVKCWGDNSYGQLGNGTSDDQSTPVDVSGLNSGVMAISAGGGHTCVLTITGSVNCWGQNNRGQLGDDDAWHAIPMTVVERESRFIFLPFIQR